MDQSERPVKVFRARTKSERQMVLLVKDIFERISDDGFAEWHAWAHDPGRGKEKCPNSSPFLSFLKAWLDADRKARLPIIMAGYQEYAKGVFGGSVRLTWRRERKG